MPIVIITKNMIKSKPVLSLYLKLAIFGGVAIAASLVLPFSISIFYVATGVPCPACGMSRAFMRFFRGDLFGALFYHPLFFLIPLIPLLAYSRMPKKARNIGWLAIGCLFLAVWIIRLILFFPHTAPMIYNENSLFELLRRVLR